MQLKFIVVGIYRIALIEAKNLNYIVKNSQMIVRKSAKGLHIIYQAAHGLLSGKLAQELKVKYRPKYWLETLLAVIEHDDQQLDFDEKNYLSNLGMPLDFTEDEASVKEILVRCQRVVSHARSKSMWSAMLVSYHLEFLYGDLGKEFVTVAKFLGEQEDFRLKSRKHFGLTKKAAKEYYEILRFCDRCSLILSKNQVPSIGRKLEINTSLGKKTFFIHRNDNDTFNVSPWCFEKDEFTISLEELIIEKTQFSNQTEFRDYLYSQSPTLIQFKFSRK